MKLHEPELDGVVVDGEDEPALAGRRDTRPAGREVRLDGPHEPRRLHGLDQEVGEAERRHPGRLQPGQEAGTGDDGHLCAAGPLAEERDQVEAVQVGEDQVQDHEVGATLRHQAERRAGVGGLEDRVALDLQRHPEHLPGDGVVLDDQDPGGHGQRTPAGPIVVRVTRTAFRVIGAGSTPPLAGQSRAAGVTAGLAGEVPRHDGGQGPRVDRLGDVAVAAGRHPERLTASWTP